ncbi:MAG: AMP-binding protein [Myxococcota bacterium]
MSFGRAITWLADQDPDRPAVLHEGTRLSRGELEAGANRLARVFAERGVKAGDLVTIALPNGADFLLSALATWKLGATPQPISARLPEKERRAIVELAQPALVVGVAPGEYGDQPTLPAGFAADPGIPADPLPDVVPQHARCVTSGGSTGRPKLILELTPGECDPALAENGMQAGGVTLVPGPLYHAGPFITCWQCLFSGGTAVLMTRFDPEQALALIEEHRVDWVLFVPTMMQRIWRLREEQRTRYDLSSLRRVMCTGAPSPAWLKRAWIDWLGPERIWEAFGGSERIAGCVISGTEWLEHPGSVGKPPPDRKVRVLDERGQECAPGEIGELWLLPPGGQGSTYRYIGAEAKTDVQGWETLGDMGYLDEDGYLYLVDRKTDMIVSGGANVYPAEVEAALDAHPAVRSSAVIGLPDDDLGQRIHAIVDAPGGVDEDSLRAHLAAELVRYKIPRSFELVDEPLRDDAGKVRRAALREARLPEPGG